MFSEASVSYSVNMGGGLSLWTDTLLWAEIPSRHRPPELSSSGSHCSGRYWNAFLLQMILHHTATSILSVKHFS